MTYNVFSGTLNPTQSVNQLVIILCQSFQRQVYTWVVVQWAGHQIWGQEVTGSTPGWDAAA